MHRREFLYKTGLAGFGIAAINPILNSCNLALSNDSKIKNWVWITPETGCLRINGRSVLKNLKNMEYMEQSYRFMLHILHGMNLRSFPFRNLCLKNSFLLEKKQVWKCMPGCGPCPTTILITLKTILNFML